MKRVQGVLLAVFALLSLGGCETEKARRYIGFQGLAAVNDFLALQRVLEAMDENVNAFSGIAALGELPATDATLAILVDRAGIVSERRDREPRLLSCR